MIVSFLSDYGPGDEYAGVVEGVILSLCPHARVVHLGHGVPPQDVRTGARRSRSKEEGSKARLFRLQ